MKYVCSVCGYTSDTLPEFCPICKAPADKFTKVDGDVSFVTEHIIGEAKGVEDDIIEGLKANFNAGARRSRWSRRCRSTR